MPVPGRPARSTFTSRFEPELAALHNRSRFAEDDIRFMRAAANSNQFMIMTNRVQIDAIQSDTAYCEGNYDGGKPPANGMAVARMVGFTTFISPVMMERKFRKYHKSEREPFTDAYFHQQRFHEAENYLHTVAYPFSADFDANSMVYLLQTWSHFDLAVEYGSLAKALEPVNRIPTSS